MARLVRDDGTGRERIVVIGESPGQHEDSQGKPFVGPAGMKLATWQRLAGLSRRDCYWTNVYPYRPKNNRIETIPPHELDPWIDDLHRRLAELTDPYVIVPTGNTALRALTGKVSITKHRGSIHEYVDSAGRRIKVIPTIHPAAIFRQPSWERRCLADWSRIAGDISFRELRLPEREHFIKPTLSDVADFVEDARQRAAILSLDIETPRERQTIEVPGKPKKDGTLGKPRYKTTYGAARVTCIAFSSEPHFSLTIPTTESYWGAHLDDVWGMIRELCLLPAEKVTQNGLFDTFYLADHDVYLRNWRWDTRWLHHAMDPLDDHDLAYMASVDTRQPFWKDEAKDPDEIAKYASNLEALWTYNGIDAAVTCELAHLYHGRVVERGYLRVYDQHYRQLFGPLLAVMRHGVRLNEHARVRTFAALQAACIAIQDKLTRLAGEQLYGAKDLSTKKLQVFLYQTLKLPAQRDRATGALTTKEITVRRLMLKYPNKLGRDDEPEKPGRLILDHRRKYKLSTFIKDGVADADGRVRCQYGFTDTGRLTSSRNPRRTGQNLQNVDRELRHLYLPDEGYFFLEVDESQGEDRIVKCLTGAERLIARARAMPWENDEHKRAAALIFPGYKRWEDVPSGNGMTPETGLHRYFGKRVRHAGNYDMHGRRLSEELLKEGIVIDPDEGEAMIRGVIDRDTPEIREYHRKIRQLVLTQRAIACSCGYTVDYTYERLNDDVFRSAYALIPQHELVCIVNSWGFVPLDAKLRKERMRSRINLQVHDSLVISTVRDEAYDIACFLKESLERPRWYWGTKLVIPTEFKLGTSWKGTVEFKRFPDRTEFNAKVDEMLANAKNPR